MPPLLSLQDEAAYRQHFENTYCQRGVRTCDGIQVFFRRQQFGHCFFESTNRDGVKDAFSTVRAERMDWIVATLQNQNADWYQGWDKKNRCHDAKRRVCVAYEEFVVVLAFSLKRNGDLKAKFVTCYLADNSIEKIRNSPQWTEEACRNALV